MYVSGHTVISPNCHNRNLTKLSEWTSESDSRPRPYGIKHNVTIDVLSTSPFYKWYKWARPWENVSYAICEQKKRRSDCASAQSDQRLCCSLPRQNDTSSLYIRNFKILAGLCSWAGQFVSCLVGDSQRYIFSWRGSSIIVICYYADYLGPVNVSLSNHSMQTVLRIIETGSSPLLAVPGRCFCCGLFWLFLFGRFLLVFDYLLVMFRIA